MTKRPLSVLVLGWLYIATGVIGLAVHLAGWRQQRSFQSDMIWIFVTELLAIAAGAYVLRGSNWARWLAVAWIAFHVVISAFNSWSQFAVHSLLCAAFAYLLFRPEATRYFRPRATST